MIDNIKIKLIHLLGGISQDEAKKFNNYAFHQGDMYCRHMIRHYLTIVEKELYGKSKQEWIDVMHKVIKSL